MDKHITTDELARMVQAGFKDMGERMATKSELGTVKDIVKMVMEEQNAMHADIRYIRKSVDILTHGDIQHEAAIQQLTERVHRLERKVGLAK